MSNDWGGGDWWNIWPPPPGEESDYYDAFDGNDQDSERPDDWWAIPNEPDYTDPSWDDNFGASDEVYDAWDYLMDIDNVDPANVRGLAFESLYEAVDWLASIGVLGFSGVIMVDDLFYPVIGEYEIEGGDDGGTPEEEDGSPDFEPIPF